MSFFFYIFFLRQSSIVRHLEGQHLEIKRRGRWNSPILVTRFESHVAARSHPIANVYTRTFVFEVANAHLLVFTFVHINHTFYNESNSFAKVSAVVDVEIPPHIPSTPTPHLISSLRNTDRKSLIYSSMFKNV